MTRATCRCGQSLNLPDGGDDRVVCPKCGAKVRIRRGGGSGITQAASVDAEGYLRFHCPCGRRLKVKSTSGGFPAEGKCPDCGRVVPVPLPGSSAPSRDPESPTDPLLPAQSSALDAWTRRHLESSPEGGGGTTIDLRSGTGLTRSPTPPVTHPTPHRSEAGLRVCPGCGKPIHLGASACRDCGIAVPRR